MSSLNVPSNLLSALGLAALEYAAQGLAVFPCGPDDPTIGDPVQRAKAAKKPACLHGFRDATTDAATIVAWWTENPTYNIGAVPASAGYVVADLDRKGGKDGVEAFEAQAREATGQAPAETWTAATPSGGQHRWYVGSVERDGPAGAVAPGVDVKSKDGYVVMPPSVVNGRPYKWANEPWMVQALPPWFWSLHAGAVIRPRSTVATADAPATGNLPPFPPEEIRARLYQCDPGCGYGAWRDLSASLHATPCAAPDFDKRALFVEWSRGGANFTSEEACEAVYDSMPPKAGGLGAGSFVKLTDAAGYSGPTVARNARAASEVFGDYPGNKQALTHAASPSLAGYPKPKSAAELVAGHFPRPDYVLEKFLLRGQVNLLYGDGGTGKTLLSLHMAVAVAAGLPLFALQTIPMPVLLVLAEDDDGETKARLEAIAAMMGVNLADLPIHTWSLPGCDASVARIRDDGAWEAGPFLEPLRAELTRIGPCLLILDTVSDIATLDETKRLPVNTLCKVVLTGLCRDFGVTALVNAHPSKAAMADGTGYAGSTAWNNAVRSRLAFDRPEANSPRRILKVAKANYGSEATLELFQSGLTFMTLAQAGQSEAEELEAVFVVVLDLIDRGVAVVRGNGAGQKPRDVAKEIKRRLGLDIPPARVLDHLNALDRHGRLRYSPGGNQRRGQRAGFCRPDFASRAAS
jgi:hypothetical protein